MYAVETGGQKETLGVIHLCAPKLTWDCKKALTKRDEVTLMGVRCHKRTKRNDVLANYDYNEISLNIRNSMLGQRQVKKLLNLFERF